MRFCEGSLNNKRPGTAGLKLERTLNGFASFHRKLGGDKRPLVDKFDWKNLTGTRILVGGRRIYIDLSLCVINFDDKLTDEIGSDESSYGLAHYRAKEFQWDHVHRLV